MNKLLSFIVLGISVPTLMASLARAADRPGPSGKIFVANLDGSGEIRLAARIDTLERRKAYEVNGAVIQTFPAEGADRDFDGFSTMVFSNGTGIYLKPDTRLEIGTFTQDPFVPGRADMNAEPSISRTEAMLARGTVALCTSQLAAGSTLVYNTPFGSLNLRGRQVVIESGDDYTRIAMLAGEGTVRAGTGSILDPAGLILEQGQQAVIRSAGPGQSPTIQVQAIPQGDREALEGMVMLACDAKRTVYFDIAEIDDTLAAGAENSGDLAAGAGVSAFSDSGAPAQEIVAIEVVPVNLPVQFTVSPARK